MVTFHVQQIFDPREKQNAIKSRNKAQLQKKRTCSTLISIAGKRLRSLLTKSPSSSFLTALTFCVSSARDERLEKKTTTNIRHRSNPFPVLPISWSSWRIIIRRMHLCRCIRTNRTEELNIKMIELNLQTNQWFLFGFWPISKD